MLDVAWLEIARGIITTDAMSNITTATVEKILSRCWLNQLLLVPFMPLLSLLLSARLLWLYKTTYKYNQIADLTRANYSEALGYCRGRGGREWSGAPCGCLAPPQCEWSGAPCGCLAPPQCEWSRPLAGTSHLPPPLCPFSEQPPRVSLLIARSSDANP